jgi:ParB/RepB/Spo0J family partition protein
MMEQAKVTTLRYDEITLGKRFRREYGDIDDLVKDIVENGLIEPLVVWKSNKENLLLAGGRRYAALGKIPEYTEGKLSVPVRVYEGDLSEEDRLSIELAENIKRKDLSWYEQTEISARIYKLQTDATGKPSTRKTGELTGKGKSQISRDIEIYNAAKEIPALRKAKSKHEAERMLKKGLRGVQANKRVTSFEKKQADIPDRAKKKALIKTYTVEDVQTWFPRIPDGWADFVELDPPYAIDLKSQKKSAYDSELVGGVGEYTEMTPEEYREIMPKVLAHSYRALGKDGWLVCWFAPEPWFEELYQWIVEAGFDVNRLPLAWFKRSGQTQQPQRYMSNSYELAFYARKGKAELNKSRLNSFDYDPVNPSKKIHRTERPIEMIVDLLSVFAPRGSRVLVPFYGSGNTGLACANYGCEVQGTDLSARNKEGFSDRVLVQPYGNYSSYDPKEDEAMLEALREERK